MHTDQANASAALFQAMVDREPEIGGEVIPFGGLDHGVTEVHSAGTKGTPPTSFRVAPIDWEALVGKTPPPREWVLPQLIPSGHPLLLAGPPGVGKTLMVQAIGSALSIHTDYLGRATRPLRVGSWFCEDDFEEIWRRQVSNAEYFGVPLDAFKDFHIVPRIGQDNLLFGKTMGGYGWTGGIAEIEEMVCDLKLDVFILDNVAQTCEDEIARSSVTRFVNRFAGLGKAAGLNTTTILLGHPGKANGSEYSGSTAWEAAVRTRLYLGAKLPDQPHDPEAIPDEKVRYLCMRKTNYSTKDVRTLTYANGVLVPDDLPDDPGQFDGRLRAKHAEGVVMRAMDRLIGLGKQPTDGQTSPNFLPRLILDFKLNEGVTKRELTNAMRELMLGHQLRRQVIGQHSNRTPKHGLVKA
jgi:hypothetical protein